MSSPPIRALCTALLCGAPVATAQQSFLPEELLAPLHTLPDDPVGGAYGLWAAGTSYKASFHDGFCFYPYRGAAGSTVRVHWRTESVRRSGVDLLGGEPRPHTTDWRHELRYGRVTEAYDIEKGGVEQTFVLHSRPPGSGDVVVVGRVASELEIPAAAAAVQALDFTEDGEPIVRYGAALAFDASGRTAEVTTACDGERITLRLPGAFVDAAEYPLTIDPLTSAVSVAFSLSGAPVVATAMAVDNEQLSGQVMLVFSRQVSATDTDAWGILLDKNPSTLGNPTAFHDIASWSTTELDACHVGGANRFAIAVQRTFGATASGVRVYLHDDFSTTTNSGTILVVPAPLGTRQQNPQLGGVRGPGDSALVVYEQDPIGSTAVDGTDAMFVAVDAAAAAIGSPGLLFATSGGDDIGRPAVMPCTDTLANPSSRRWLAAIVEKRPMGHDLIHCLLCSNISVLVSQSVASSLDPLDSVAVAGSLDIGGRGRCLVAWVRRATGLASGHIETLRVDADQTNGVSPHSVLDVVTSSPVLGDLQLAADPITRSHWALTYSQTNGTSSSVTVARLGGSGAIVESQLMESSSRPGELAVAYSRQSGGQRFLACYAVEDSFDRIYVRHLLYDPNAGATIYGTGCNGAFIQANSVPHAGNLFFDVEIGPLSTSPDFALVAIGWQPANSPLPWPGCSLLVNPQVSFLRGSQSSTAIFRQALPDRPLITGDLYIQAGILSTFAVTPGLEVRIR